MSVTIKDIISANKTARWFSMGTGEYGSSSKNDGCGGGATSESC
jgi:hypothetical protein